jgi:hypothetical protein
VTVDYVSKWVEAMPCKNADTRYSKKMFEEIIFPRFGIPRMVISDGGTHFTDRKFHLYVKIMEFVTTSLHYIILRQVARHRHEISRSRIFYRRR